MGEFPRLKVFKMEEAQMFMKEKDKKKNVKKNGREERKKSGG